MLYVWLTTQLIYLPLYQGLDANGETQILDLLQKHRNKNLGSNCK